MEINPQSNIVPDSPNSGNEHIFTYTLTWSPSSDYRARINIYTCDGQEISSGYSQSGFCTLTCTGNGRHEMNYQEQRWGYNANYEIGWWNWTIPGSQLKAFIDGIDQNDPQNVLGRTDGLFGNFNLNIGGAITPTHQAALSINAIDWGECNQPGWYFTDPLVLQITSGSEFITLYDIANQIELGSYVQLNNYTEINNIRLREKQPPQATTIQTIILEAEINGVIMTSETQYYPEFINEQISIDVQIVPSEIMQGDTASVILKKRTGDVLEDFSPGKLFNVEIVESSEYGWILDSLSSDTLISFENIYQGFKIIAKDSTGIDSTKIRIKVSTEDDGPPVAMPIKDNIISSTNEKLQTENKKNDGKTILPNSIGDPGVPMIEGFGDVVVGNDWCDDLDECDEIEFPDVELEVHENGWQNLDACIDTTWIAGTGYFPSDNNNYREDFEIEICKQEGSDKLHFTFDDDIIINCVSDICEANIIAGRDILISNVYSFPSSMSCAQIISCLEKHELYPMPTTLNDRGTIIDEVYIVKDIWMRHEKVHRDIFLEIAEGLKAKYLLRIKNTMEQCSDFKDEETAKKSIKQKAEDIIRDFYDEILVKDKSGEIGNEIDVVHHKVVVDYLRPLINRWKKTNCTDPY